MAGSPRNGVRACVVGSINVDLFLRVERLPSAGETVLARSTSRAVGGKGANQAVGLARLGATTSLIGAVGDDDDGRVARAAIGAAGVALDGVRDEPELPTGRATITVDAHGDNTIVVTSGANDACTAQIVRREAERIAQADLVVAQLEISTDSVLEAFGIVDADRTLRVLNAAPARPVPDGLFRLVDVLVVNEVEAALLSGVADDPERAARALLARGPQIVAVTLGEHGSLAVDHSGKAARAHAHPVRPVDATGAGDAFVGCFALLAASGASLGDALRAANVAAALSTQVAGAQAGLPTWADVERALG